VSPLVAHVGDVQQAVDAAQIHERTVIGDVLDHAIDDLAFGQVLDQARTLFSAGFFQHSAARNHDVATTAIHLQDLEGLGHIHQRGDVAHGADVDLAAGQEGHGAVEVNGEAALDAAEDHAFNALAFAKFVFKLVPCGFATCTVAAQHGFAFGVFNAVDVNFDFVANLQTVGLAGHGEFAQGHAAFALEANVDDGLVVFDGGNGALDDAAFKATAGGSAQRFVKQRGKIVARRVAHGIDPELLVFPARRLFPPVFPPPPAPCGPRAKKGRVCHGSRMPPIAPTSGSPPLQTGGA
jgi:hypothetical protein